MKASKRYWTALSCQFTTGKLMLTVMKASKVLFFKVYDQVSGSEIHIKKNFTIQ